MRTSTFATTYDSSWKLITRSFKHNKLTHFLSKYMFSIITGIQTPRETSIQLSLSHLHMHSFGSMLRTWATHLHKWYTKTLKHRTHIPFLKCSDWVCSGTFYFLFKHWYFPLAGWIKVLTKATTQSHTKRGVTAPLCCYRNILWKSFISLIVTLQITVNQVTDFAQLHSKVIKQIQAYLQAIRQQPWSHGHQNSNTIAFTAYQKSQAGMILRMSLVCNW